MAKQVIDPELDEILGGNMPSDLDDFDEGPVEEAVYEFDFSQTGDVKDGIYHAKVQEFLPGTSQTGNPKWDLDFHVPEIGRKLSMALPRVPSAAWKAGMILRSLGFEPAEGETTIKFTRKNVVGRLCKIEVKNEPYQGRNVPKIMMVHPADRETKEMFADF